jgi:Uma2 family endonuclease
MKQPRQTELTADEFISWARQQPEGRFELDNGVIVGMSPERVSDLRAKFNVAVALRLAIAGGGLPCETLPDGASLRVGERTVYEPDALVRCGPPLPGDTIEVSDPLIVVEVVSPSSGGIDRGVKLAGYFSLPSVRHYLIVATDSQVVIHHRRDGEGQIGVRILHADALTLDPPGLSIDVRDIFDGI